MHIQILFRNQAVEWFKEKAVYVDARKKVWYVCTPVPKNTD